MTRSHLVLLVIALAAACTTTGAGAPAGAPADQTEQTDQVKKPARPKPEATYHDLTRSDGKDGADPEKESLRRQLYERFSIDALLKCAQDDAVACPSPVTVRLRVDAAGTVKSVSLKPAKPENKVWLGCLEETYKQVSFDPQPRPMTIKTRFHVECTKS